jgi:hypothetical protein
VIEMLMKIPENHLIPSEWPVFLFFGILGLALVVYACVLGYQSHILSRVGVTTQGRIVGVEEYKRRSKDDEGRPTTDVSYRLLIEFSAVDGAKHRLTGETNLPKYALTGSPVRVLYDPKDPSTARIAGTAKLGFWGPFLSYGSIGFLLLVGSIGSFFFAQHQLTRDHADYAEIRRERENEDKLHRENQIRRIMADGTVLRLKGVVESVRKQQGASTEEYVVVCWATRPGETSQERYEAAAISFDPGPAIVGKNVEVYIHRDDKTRYQVDLEPVLAELQSARR